MDRLEYKATIDANMRVADIVRGTGYTPPRLFRA